MKIVLTLFSIFLLFSHIDAIRKNSDWFPIWGMPELSVLAGLESVPDNVVSIQSEDHTRPPPPSVGVIPPTSAIIFLTGSSDNSPSNFVNGFDGFSWRFQISADNSEECDIDELDKILAKIEDKIEEIINNTKIRPENIILAGELEGGFMTLWTALFSKIRLGGFIFSFDIFKRSPLEEIIYRNVSNTNFNAPILHFYPSSESNDPDSELGLKVFLKVAQSFNHTYVEAGKKQTFIDLQQVQKMESNFLVSFKSCLKIYEYGIEEHKEHGNESENEHSAGAEHGSEYGNEHNNEYVDKYWNQNENQHENSYENLYENQYETKYAPYEYGTEYSDYSDYSNVYYGYGK